jgi:hypothetical protein
VHAADEREPGHDDQRGDEQPEGGAGSAAAGEAGRERPAGAGIAAAGGVGTGEERLRVAEGGDQEPAEPDPRDGTGPADRDGGRRTDGAGRAVRADRREEHGHAGRDVTGRVPVVLSEPAERGPQSEDLRHREPRGQVERHDPDDRPRHVQPSDVPD